jgi:hypothetical protein
VWSLLSSKYVPPLHPHLPSFLFSVSPWYSFKSSGYIRFTIYNIFRENSSNNG